MDYTLIKYLHILSASLLFGTGLGSAFYKWRTDKSHDLGAVVTTNKNVVLADWLFTTPTVVIQPLSGVWLAQRQGYSWSESWLLLAIMLFIFAGICWLIVVYLQIRMRDVSVYALTNHTELPAVYKHHANIWFWLGITAFSCIIVVYALMVSKPSFLPA